MAMGMSYDDYWHSDYTAYRCYREAWKIRRKEENRRDWLLGAYIYNAVTVALANGFRKKGAQQQKYLEEPFQIFPLTKEEQEAKDNLEMERMNEQLRAWAEKAKREKTDGGIRHPID